MEAIKITLNDYILSGGGANGESYDHKTDPSVMLKLYFPGKIQQPLDEMMLARKVYAMGIRQSQANMWSPKMAGTASASSGFWARPPIQGPRATIPKRCSNMPMSLPNYANSCTPRISTPPNLRT